MVVEGRIEKYQAVPKKDGNKYCESLEVLLMSVLLIQELPSPFVVLE